MHSIRIDLLILGLIFSWHLLGFRSCEVLPTSAGLFRDFEFRKRVLRAERFFFLFCWEILSACSLFRSHSVCEYVGRDSCWGRIDEAEAQPGVCL